MKQDLRLTSFFSLVSIPVIILAIILLAFIYRLVVLEGLHRQVEQNNITVTKTLSNAIWEEIRVLELSPDSSEGRSLNNVYVEVISTKIYELLNNTPILKVKVFAINGETVYSTNIPEIGTVKSLDYPGMRVIKTDQPYSSTEHADSFMAINGNLTNVDVLSTYIPVYNKETGIVEGVFEIYTDITDSKKKIKESLFTFTVILAFVLTIVFLALYIMVKHAEKVISRSKDALRQKIQEVENINKALEEKTRELAIARDVANHANMAKSQFLANMSHELRTPLNAILGYSELIKDEVGKFKNDEINSDLDKVHQAGTHLLELIDGILDLSKIEAGQMELHREAFDVENLLYEIHDTMMPLVKRNHNELIMDVELGGAILFGDVMKIRQILFNLISNAAKFTSNGKITISSRLLTINNDKKIVFEILDTGIGISSKNLDKLFDPFEQEDISTTRKYGGTGLGLTITKRFCTIMEGEIEVDSEPGKGTKFIVYLPFIEAPPIARAAV